MGGNRKHSNFLRPISVVIGGASFATDVTVAWSVRLSVRLSHLCTLLKPLHGRRCRLALILVSPKHPDLLTFMPSRNCRINSVSCCC